MIEEKCRHLNLYAHPNRSDELMEMNARCVPTVFWLEASGTAAEECLQRLIICRQISVTETMVCARRVRVSSLVCHEHNHPHIVMVQISKAFLELVETD